MIFLSDFFTDNDSICFCRCFACCCQFLFLGTNLVTVRYTAVFNLLNFLLFHTQFLLLLVTTSLFFIPEIWKFQFVISCKSFELSTLKKTHKKDIRKWRCNAKKRKVNFFFGIDFKKKNEKFTLPELILKW